MMHCDISGFTAMSERLAGLGKEGAELMVDVLNKFFDSMLRIALDYGGVQMKFGGDAMLLYFGGDRHAARAAACGIEMQAAMTPYRQFLTGGQEHGLAMRAGIASGKFFSASAGETGGLMHYVLAGLDVSRSVLIEEETGLGEVCGDAATAKALEPAAVTKVGKDLWRIGNAGAGRAPPPNIRASNQLLGRYLATPIKEGQTTGPGEHRRVTTVFINVLGLEELAAADREGDALSACSTLVETMTATLNRHGGYFLGSDVSGEGIKFIGLFGAPIASVGQEAAAMRFALDFRERLKDSGAPLTIKTGINTGYVFAGEVGWRHRREYTVIGDDVNLAARLMSAAKVGEILVSRATAAAEASSFELRNVRPVAVKGKSQPVKICRLLRQKQVQPSIAPLPLVGREREMARLIRALRSSQRGAFHHVHISGEPGIGKSRLVEEFAERASKLGEKVIRLTFQSYESGTPFAAWRSMLGSRDDASAEAALRAIEEIGESDDPRARREATISALATFIEAQAPCLVLIEDEYHADESSLGVIDRLISMRLPGLVICVTSRLPSAVPARPHVTIELQPLGPDSSEQIIQEMAASAHSRVDIRAIAERARGNPLFLVEMMKAPDLAGSVPDTLNDVVTARIDALRPDERQALRVMAVAGDPFTPAFVEQLARPTIGDRTTAILPTLVRRGFMAMDGEGPTHRFTHSILGEVAYESASFAFRRRIHFRAGKIIENEHAGDEGAVAEILLHHFERAGNSGKTVRYASLAGDRSASVFANTEALGFYERGLTAVSQRERPADTSVLLERKADVLESSGRHSDAVAALDDSLQAFVAAPRARPRYVVGGLSLSNREPLLCQKLAVATEHTSDYDAALQWLDRARSTLSPRDARLRAKVYATTCAVLLRKGQYTEAVDWGKRAIRTARGASDLRQVAYTQHMLGTALAEAGHLRQGVRLLRRSVRAYHELGDYRGQASANSNLGSTYLLLGMYDAALYHYEVAQIADQRTGDDIDAAIVHNNMAETLLLLDREDEAVHRLEEALAIASREPDLIDLQGWAEVTMARCLRAKGDLEGSSHHLSRGLRLLRSVGSTGLLTEALVDFAEQALAESNAHLGMRRASRALRHAIALDSRLAEARARRVMGECLLAQGQPDEGEARLVEALHGSRRANAEYEEARVSVALGKAYLASGRRGGARRVLRRAHRTYASVGAARQADLAALLLVEAGG